MFNPSTPPKGPTPGKTGDPVQDALSKVLNDLKNGDLKPPNTGDIIVEKGGTTSIMSKDYADKHPEIFKSPASSDSNQKKSMQYGYLAIAAIGLYVILK